ncbi:hypothetical protein BJX64DRAFT_287886 [Aspergillus heterothallicus]
MDFSYDTHSSSPILEEAKYGLVEHDETSEPTVGRGFVQHPEIAPALAGLTVYHQLHCLRTIISAYYAATEPTSQSSSLSAHHHNSPSTNSSTSLKPDHISHCFDYLRQTIMCAADTNLEVLEPDADGTSGWGQPRVCRDYQQVFEWASKWPNPKALGSVME